MNTHTDNDNDNIDWAAERDQLQEAHNLMRREYCSIVNGRVHTAREYDDDFRLSCAEYESDGTDDKLW